MSAIIQLLSNCSPLAGLWSGRRHRGLLWWYLWVCLVCDIAGHFAAIHHWPRLHANFFLLMEFLLVSGYFLSALAPQSFYKKAGWCCIALTSVLFLLSCSPQQANYTGGAVLYGFLLLWCIAALYKVIHELEQVKIEQSALFIFSAGFLLYTSGSFIMLLIKINLAKEEPVLMDRIWDVHNLLNIIKNLAIAYVFTLPRNKK